MSTAKNTYIRAPERSYFAGVNVAHSSEIFKLKSTFIFAYLYGILNTALSVTPISGLPGYDVEGLCSISPLTSKTTELSKTSGLYASIGFAIVI